MSEVTERTEEELTEQELKNYAELAQRITEALYLIQNKGKIPYTAYQGAKNFLIATLVSYRDGIIAMLEGSAHDKTVVAEDAPEEKAEETGDTV